MGDMVVWMAGLLFVLSLARSYVDAEVDRKIKLAKLLATVIVFTILIPFAFLLPYTKYILGWLIFTNLINLFLGIYMLYRRSRHACNGT